MLTVDGGDGDSESGRLHVAAVSVPKEPLLEPVAKYPSSHFGWHDEPLAKELVQLLTAPFAGGEDASHGFGEHFALVSTRSKHDDVPETVYPASHVG